jgi:hypothetical protein
VFSVLKQIFFLVFIYSLSAQALGGFFSAVINKKEYHIYISVGGTSYLYRVGSDHSYFLKKEIVLGTIKTYQIFESNHRDKSSGSIKIADGKLESFELDSIKAKNIKLKPLKLPIEIIAYKKQIYNNDKCSFRFIDLNSVHDLYLFKEVSFLISDIMDSFKDFECDYLKSSQADELKADLNQLSCESEMLILKKRFYGLTFTCKANMAKSTDYKYRVFSIIFDSTLKARTTKTDFTADDIPAVDDYRGLDFRLTPVGLGLYSTTMFDSKEEYIRIIPYIDLKKNFAVWGKPKRYLSNFVLK